MDGHVHIYREFDLRLLLDSAVRHFDRAAASLRLSRGAWIGALVLTESRDDRAFDGLCDGVLPLPQGWSKEPRAEEIALTLCAPDGRRLLLVAGQQIVTEEGLEVLGIGITDRCADGRPIAESIDWVRSRDAVAVLPWGFGKWSFGRGQIMSRLIGESAPGAFALGDNSGRLRFGPVPRLLRSGQTRGFAVLPGTDPLPFAGQAARVGSAGFVLQGWQGGAQPGRELVERIRQLDGSPPRYARLTGLIDFARLQVAMQLRKVA